MRFRRPPQMRVTWLPGQESEHLNYTPVLHPRTGKPLAVPALIVPKWAVALPGA